MSALPSAGSTQRTRAASRAQRNNTGGAETNNNAKPGRVMGRGGGDPAERRNGGEVPSPRGRGARQTRHLFFSGCNQTGTRLPGGVGERCLCRRQQRPPGCRSEQDSLSATQEAFPSLLSPTPPPCPPSQPINPAEASLPPHRRWETPPRRLRRRPARTLRSPARSHAWGAAGWGRGM